MRRHRERIEVGGRASLIMCYQAAGPKTEAAHTLKAALSSKAPDQLQKGNFTLSANEEIYFRYILENAAISDGRVYAAQHAQELRRNCFDAADCFQR
jgi:hypothetical protein